MKAILAGQKIITELPEHIVIADSFDWGDQSEVGEEDWWLKLQNWIASASDAQLEACVGMKKKVSLSQPVAGWEKASMICIGVNIDGDKTLTFQTEYTSPTSVKFSDTNAEWDGSNVQILCNNFAEYCSASKALKTVTVKYRKELNGNNRNLPADSQYECKCFLPSECQIGLDKWSPSQGEWTIGGKEEKYPYYSDDTKRKKFRDTVSGAGTGSTERYWERSRSYNTSTSACAVNSDGSSISTDYSAAIACLSPIFVIGAPSFNWGDEEGEATPEWWQSLRISLADASEAELATYLGKTKKVVMTEPILGTTEWLAQCIGYNCDRDKNNLSANCLTFQSKDCFADTTVFDDSSPIWSTSTVRELCGQVYNVLPFKNMVATVSKGTATTQDNNQNAPVEYTDETVFLPSDCEMGFKAGKSSNSDLGYASSYNEFCEQNIQKVAYQAYIDKTSRIKYKSSSAYAYWNRSRHYYNATYVCYVNDDGYPNYTGYRSSYYFAPAFAVAADLTPQPPTIDGQIPKIATLYDHTTGEVIVPKTTVEAIQGLGNVVQIKKVPLYQEVKSQDISVGDTVSIKIDGKDVEMLVVHKGNPDPELYDDSCDGVWVITKDCYTEKQWDSINNDYANSDIHSLVNDNFYSLIDESIKSYIKEVKIPYRYGSGTNETPIYSKENGLQCHSFVLSCYEVGFTQSDSSDGMATDGAKLDYFESGTTSNANNKRIAYYNGSTKFWWLRSPLCRSGGNVTGVYGVYTQGSISNSGCSNTYGIRPCFILSNDVDLTFYRDTDGILHTEQAYQYNITELDGTPIPQELMVQIANGSYAGTGSSTIKLIFGFSPKFLAITDYYASANPVSNAIAIFVYPNNFMVLNNGGGNKSQSIPIKLQEKGISSTSFLPINQSTHTYYYLALG